jgi:zeaxanthin glucosyltransferase
MSRILFSSFAAKGHINPILAVAKGLLDLGHSGAWLARKMGAMTGQPELPGVEMLDMDWNWLPDGQELQFAGVARNFAKYIAFNMEGRVNSIEPLIPRYRRAIRSFGAELLITDAQIYPALIAAHLEGIPYVCVITSPACLMPQGFTCDLTRTLEAVASRRAAIFEQNGLPAGFAGWEYFSPYLNLIFAVPEFVAGGTPLPPRTFLAGRSIYFERGDDPTDFPWHRLDEARPLAYVSFGTLYWDQPDLFQTVALAAESLGLQLVASLGPLVDTDFVKDLPPSTVAVRYAPQLRLLERAAVAISHGGANTIAEGLYYNVPQLIIPLCSDQPINGHFLEQAGAGISIAPSALTFEACREALARLLPPNSPYRDAARRLGQAYRASDGVTLALRLITPLLQPSRGAGIDGLCSTPSTSAVSALPASRAEPGAASREAS